jgi:RHS repeat-associated protein
LIRQLSEFAAKGFKPTSGVQNNDYTYDNVGNQTSDPHKRITTIAYNYLNLPSVITWANGNKIEILYDAAGMKLSKKVSIGTTEQYTQHYLGGIEYTGTGSTRKLEAIYFADGRVYNTNVTTTSSTVALRYEYAIRDHLENTRIMFADLDGSSTISLNEVLQENHYYPFGMNMEGVWMNDLGSKDNKYTYNGKELNEDFGLNWSDYGARWYDAAVGRWGQVDDLATEFSNWSPYNYVLNNPIIMVDPSGMYPIYSDRGEYLGDDGRSGDGDLAFIGRVAARDKDGKAIKFENLTQFTDNHTDFQIAANLVKAEAADGGADAALWIAHTANNAHKDDRIDYKKRNNTLKEQLADMDYSTTNASERTGLSTSDNSRGAKDARSAVINVLMGFADPTGGAVLWDGLDFLDDGLKHNKFREYTSVNISEKILDEFVEYGSNQNNRNKVNRYYVVDCIFEETKGDFSQKGNSNRYFSISATGTKGGSIFWKLGKK